VNKKKQTMVDNEKMIRAGVVVITGAGSGLGRALAINLADRGLKVVGFGRNKSALQETASLINKGRFYPMVVDVADSSVVDMAFVEIEKSYGTVTLLINNAAIFPRLDFLDETPDSFQETMSVNLGGVITCTHSALKYMKNNGLGRILNVASFADIAPMPASSAYSVSKGAARILTKALVADLADRFPDIVITDWLPGMLATGMGVPDGLDPAAAAKWGAALALWHDPSLNGVTFEQNCELLAPRPLKRRVKDLILLRKSPVARKIIA